MIWKSKNESVQLSHSVMSNSLQPHGLQYNRLLCPSPTPRACSNHVHWVSDAIQQSHPLSSPSAFNLCQHQSLFQWVSSSHQVAKVSELQLQHQSLQWILRTDNGSNTRTVNIVDNIYGMDNFFVLILFMNLESWPW